MKHFVLYILLLITFALQGQQNFTLYGLDNSIAASDLNPSNSPDCKWYLGLPVMSNLNLAYSNSGFHMNDLIKVINDSMQINYSSALGAMNKHNFIGINAQVGLISFGFKYKKRNYFSFSTSLKNTINFRYDREPLELVIVGNGPFINTNKKINFETNSSSYIEYAFGFSRTYAKDRVRFGGKIKILSGIANINTKKKEIYLKTNNENYGIEVTSDIDYRTSGVNGNSISAFGPNLGAAIDFGFYYKWRRDIEFSGSILDLGAIRWKDNVRNYRSNAPGSKQVFEGMQFSDFFDEGKSYKNAAQDLFDSLQSEFSLEENSNAYTSSIPTQLYLNVNYSFRKNTTLGITGYSYFFKNRPIPGIGLSLNQRMSKNLNFITSYSYYNKEVANIGLGFNYFAGCVQWTLATDNILSYMEYATANNINVSSSIRFLFGKGNKLPKYIRKQNRFHRRHRGGHGNASF